MIEDYQVTTITKYVGVWMWMIVSLMFLIGTFIMLALIYPSI